MDIEGPIVGELPSITVRQQRSGEQITGNLVKPTLADFLMVYRSVFRNYKEVIARKMLNLYPLTAYTRMGDKLLVNNNNEEFKIPWLLLYGMSPDIAHDTVRLSYCDRQPRRRHAFIG